MALQPRLSAVALPSAAARHSVASRCVVNLAALAVCRE
jgi:hypothetical protein